MGETVNVASRLVGVSKTVSHASIVISDRVAEAISAEFNCQSIGPTQIRGLAEPLQLHMISGRGAETKERKAA
jgi:class 3 adenylate cyclase